MPALCQHWGGLSRGCWGGIFEKGGRIEAWTLAALGEGLLNSLIDDIIDVVNPV